MCLCFRSIRQNVEIYINGELRAEYKAEDFVPEQKIPISDFVMTDLNDSDASGTIDIAVTSMDNGTEKYSSVTYAYGNNVWFPYITGADRYTGYSSGKYNVNNTVVKAGTEAIGC